MEIPQRVLMIFRAEALNVAKSTFKGCNVQYAKFEDLAGLLTAEIYFWDALYFLTGWPNFNHQQYEVTLILYDHGNRVDHGDLRMAVTTRIFTFCSFVTCYFFFPRGGSDHR